MPSPPTQIRLPGENVAYRQALRVTWIGIWVIIAMAAVKVLAGIWTRSTALIADGFENVADAGVSVAAIIGLRIARRPADADHPYGHGKAEVLSALIIAWLMIILAMGMAAKAVYDLFAPGELLPPRWPAVLFLAGACIVGEGLHRYKMWQARLLNSAVLRAEAYDHRKDVLSSLIALVAVGLAVGFGGPLAVLDPIAALVTCGFIGWMALRILRESTPHLMDTAISGSLLGEIRQLAERADGVLGTEKLIARRSGLDVIVELHVEVDPAMSVADAHVVASVVRDAIVARFESVTDVLVHVEPFYQADHVNP